MIPIYFNIDPQNICVLIKLDGIDFWNIKNYYALQKYSRRAVQLHVCANIISNNEQNTEIDFLIVY